jgi:8-oxo-dGTP diphosphatase
LSQGLKAWGNQGKSKQSLKKEITMCEIGLGVKGLITMDDKILVLIKSNGELDLPGGRVEDVERDEDCLHRETLEETGLKVKIIDIVSHWSFQKTSHLLIIGKTFICDYFDGIIALSDEHVDYFWFDPAKHIDLFKLDHKYKFQSFLYKRSFF